MAWALHKALHRESDRTPDSASDRPSSLASPVALALVAGFFGMAGCLTAPPIQEEPVVEHAPVIDLALVSPSTDSVVRIDLSQDQDRQFNIAGAVSDADGDTLYYVWSVSDAEGVVQELPVNSRTPTYSLRPCKEDIVLPPTEEGRLAIVFLRVDIADRPRREPESVDAGGEDVGGSDPYPDGAHVETMMWVIAMSGICPP